MLSTVKQQALIEKSGEQKCDTFPYLKTAWKLYKATKKQRIIDIVKPDLNK